MAEKKSIKLPSLDWIEILLIIGIVFSLSFIAGIAFGGCFLCGNCFDSSLAPANMAADNFCEAWAREEGFNHFKGSYEFSFLEGWKVHCIYFEDRLIRIPDLENHGRKYFKMDEEDLKKWVCEKCPD